jgi:predicted CXXCH cytochrome family protein
LGGSLETKYVSLVVEMPYPDKRSMVLEINDKCRTCHEDEYKSTDGSAHEKVFESGNVNAPMCVDCHGGHNTIKPGTPRTTIVDICGKCHSSVKTSYSVSVHGETLLRDPTNPDVPTCINCHGVHSVRGPREVTFRGDSVVICGECHANKELMKKYDISTKVFDTYLNDFHGRTVSLFQEAGRTSSNKATCYDCHGVHNIRRPTDSLSSVYPANLQHTCQQCHDEATIRFPAAWLSHNDISWESNPLLFSLKIAYSWFLIPGTIGAFVLYIALDARRRWMDKNAVVLQAIAEEEVDE